MSTCEESQLPATTHSKRREPESGYASRMRAIANQIAKGEFKVKTYVDGGQRWCDYRDLAAFPDECRDRAETSA